MGGLRPWRNGASSQKTECRGPCRPRKWFKAGVADEIPRVVKLDLLSGASGCRFGVRPHPPDAATRGVR